MRPSVVIGKNEVGFFGCWGACMVRKGINHLHLFVPVRNLHRSETLPVLQRLICTLVEEKVDHLDVALFDSTMQGRVSIEVLVVDVGTDANKNDGTVHMTITRRKEQWRVALVRLCIDGCIVLKQSINHIDMALYLDSCMERRQADVVCWVLAASSLIPIFDCCQLVAHGALVCVGAVGLVRCHFEAEAALDVEGRLGLWNAVLHLGATRNEDSAYLREATTRGDCEGWKDCNVQVAIVLALHILYERVDVVGLDGLHQRLRFPAQARTLATHAHRRQVLELGQRPGFGGAIPAEHVSAHATMVLADDEREHETARLALRNAIVVNPVGA